MGPAKRAGAAFAMISLLTALLVATSSVPANGTNWWGATGAYGQCTGGNRTDAAPMSFHYSDLTTHMADATSWIRINRIPNSDIGDTVWHSTAQTNTDVIVFDRFYDDYCSIPWDQGVLGLTTCRSTTTTDRCNQANVRYNNTFTSNWAAQAERSLACHEVRHAIGLRHREDLCMETVGLTNTGYSDHDRAHINAAF